MRHETKILTILVSLTAISNFAPSGAWAQAASNVTCGKCVDATDLASKAVVKRTIKKGAVAANRIAPGAVDAARLANGAVTEAKLGAGAVSTAKLAAGAAGPGKFANGAVGPDKLADGTIGNAQLAAGSVSGAIGPVTATKLADGTIGAAQIATDAVTATAIAAGAVSGAKLADGAVTNAQLVVGAIVNTQLESGAVVGDKIADGVLTADKLDAAALDANVSFAQTVFVSPVGPAATDNCTELQDALAGITDNGAAKPYVIKIEPGVYDCGTTSVEMKPFVDIEGSGEGVTTIRGITPDIIPVVRGAGNAELRFLTVEHGGGVSDARAIVSNDADFSLRQVTAISQGGSMFAIAITITGSARLIDVTATALSNMAADRAVAVFVFDTTAELDNVIATASGPGVNDALNITLAGGVATARGSVFAGTNAVRAVASAAGNFVGSQLEGNFILLTGATVSCVKAYNGGFLELPPACS